MVGPTRCTDRASHPFGRLEALYSILETPYSRALKFPGGGEGIGCASLRDCVPILRIACSPMRAHRTQGSHPFGGMPRPRVTVTRAHVPPRKISWRRGRDSNPRNLAVHLISNQTQSTTLPPLLTRTIEEVRGSPAGKRKVPAVRLGADFSPYSRGRDASATRPFYRGRGSTACCPNCVFALPTANRLPPIPDMGRVEHPCSTATDQGWPALPMTPAHYPVPLCCSL
jgi:hypothetical protein